jgi:amino acid adenylation domain-containing protein
MMAEPAQKFRLSPQQKRLWQLQQAAPVYRADCLIEIAGELDAGKLKGALERVVARHEILRTIFERPPGLRVPVQVIHGEGTASWREVSLTDSADLPAEVERLREREAERYFDLEGGPLLRALLIGITDASHLLLLGLPALCADAWSFRNLVRELAGAYGVDGAGGAPAEPEEVVQYAQFTEWKHELLQDSDAEAGRRHWRQLDLQPALRLRLPGQRAAADDRALAPAVHRVELDAARADQLDALGRESRTTLSVLLLAAWQALLWRLTGESEIVLGCVLEGSRYEELAEVMGPVAATIPVAVQLEPDLRFADLLGRTGEAVSEAQGWQEYFLAEEVLPPAAGPGFLPVAYEFDELAPATATAGVAFRILTRSVRADRYRVKLTCIRGEAGLTLELHYDREALTAESVKRLAAELERVLDSVARNPEIAVGDIEVLGERERRQLLAELAGARRELPGDPCLHHLVEAQAEHSPESVAVRRGEQLLTYAELDRRANRLARHLRSHGVGPEVLVAVCLERSPALVVSLLAVLKAGGAYLPLDPAYPRERLEHMLRDARPAVLLTEESLSPLLPEGAAATVLVDRDRDAVARQDGSRLDGGAAAGNLAYVIYTSGSTGMPKGAMITHRGLGNYAIWAAEAYDAAGGEGAPVHSPLGFDLTVTSLFTPLLAGRTVELLAEEQGVEALVGALRRPADYSLVKLTPVHLELLVQQLGGEKPAARVRTLVVGGEALFGEALASWWNHSPGTRIVNEYGPTETVVGSCVYVADRERDGTGAVPIGRPIANTRIQLLDSRLHPVPIGVLGEMYIGGDGVARGYLDRPDLTAERFVPDPTGTQSGARLYRTGDLATYADGQLRFLGRNDDQLKISGFRIEPGEIEAVLKRREGVRDAVVLAREDSVGDKRLVAYLVKEDGAVTDPEELRHWVGEKLPEHMVPASFLWMAAFPLTANGKVDRRQLPAPDSKRPELSGAYVAPRSALEQLLAEVWSEVLKIDPIGVHDSFFSLGGDSIRSVRLAAAAKERGVTFTVQQLFRRQTIAELAHSLEIEAGVSLSAAAVPANVDPELEDLFAEVEGLSAEQVREALRSRLGAAGEED